jgi:hypothetical protein
MRWTELKSACHFAELVIQAAKLARHLHRQHKIRELTLQDAKANEELDACEEEPDESIKLFALLDKLAAQLTAARAPDPRDASDVTTAARAGLQELYRAISSAISRGHLSYFDTPMPISLIPSDTDCLVRGSSW